MLRPTISLLFVLTLTFTQIMESKAGFYGGQCPPDVAQKNGVTLSCPADCIAAHNAIWGTCGEGEDYNCYCTPSMQIVQVALLIRQNCPIQCYDQSNKGYEDLCRVDCLCNHGATGYNCNYFTKGCECTGRVEDPTKNKLCPFTNMHDMIVYLNDLKLPNVEFGVPAANGSSVQAPPSIIKCGEYLSFNVKGL